MIDQKRKKCHLRFKAICYFKASNFGNYLILLVTVFIRKEWLRLLTLLKTGLLRQISSDKLLQIRKINSKLPRFWWWNWQRIGRILVFLFIEHFGLIRLCWNLTFKFLAFRFFCQSKVLFYIKNLLEISEIFK